MNSETRPNRSLKIRNLKIVESALKILPNTALYKTF